MRTITFEIEGTMPLLLNNPRTINPFDEYARKKKEINAKRKKTEEDQLELMHLDFLSSVYQNKAGQYIIPGDCFKKTLEDAAKEKKLGKKFEQNIQILSDAVIDFEDNTKTPEELYNNGISKYVDVRACGLHGIGGTKKINVTRFIIPEWKTQVQFIYDESQVEAADIISVFEVAGLRYGVGTYRKKFGRFTPKVKK